MSASVPVIRTTQELLTLMRASPATRIVGEFGSDSRRAVIDCPHEVRLPRRVLAYLDSGSAADHLVTAAIQAATASPEIWRTLPLRYHDFFSACLLPEHPNVRSGPSSGDENDEFY